MSTPYPTAYVFVINGRLHWRICVSLNEVDGRMPVSGHSCCELKERLCIGYATEVDARRDASAYLDTIRTANPLGWTD